MTLSVLMLHLKAVEYACDMANSLKAGGAATALRVVFGRKPSQKQVQRLYEQLTTTMIAVDIARGTPE